MRPDRDSIRSVSTALEPTEDGVRVLDIKAVLDAYGLDTFPREAISLRELEKNLRRNALAIFPIRASPTSNHYVIVLNHPQDGLLVIDPPAHKPMPLKVALGDRLFEPIGGLALIVIQPAANSAKASSRLTVSPDDIDLGTFSMSDSEASKPHDEFVTIGNSSDRAVMVDRVASTCGCVAAGWGGGLIRPGESKTMRLRVSRGAWKPGQSSRFVVLACSDGSETSVRLTGNGVLDHPDQRLEVSPDVVRVSLDDVPGGAHSIERVVSIEHPSVSLSDVRIVHDYPWLSAKLAAEGPAKARLSLRLDLDRLPDEADRLPARIKIQDAGQLKREVAILFSRKPSWRLSPDFVTVSRRELVGHELVLASTTAQTGQLTEVSWISTPEGLQIEAIPQPDQSVRIKIRHDSVGEGVFVIQFVVRNGAHRCVLPLTLQVR